MTTNLESVGFTKQEFARYKIVEHFNITPSKNENNDHSSCLQIHLNRNVHNAVDNLC